MAVIPHPTGPADDLPAAVQSAAEALVLLWSQSEEALPGRVSPSQLRALDAIQRHGSLNLAALGAELGALPSSASRLCDRLVAAGLVVREPAQHTRREVRLQLSEQGRRMLAELARHRRSRLAAVLAEMSPQGREALVSGLREFAATAGGPVLPDPVL